MDGLGAVIVVDAPDFLLYDFLTRRFPNWIGADDHIQQDRPQCK
jgi:hypothetical protein